MDYLDRGEVEHVGGGRDGGEVRARVEPSVLLRGPWPQQQLVKRNLLLINKGVIGVSGDGGAGYWADL